MGDGDDALAGGTALRALVVDDDPVSLQVIALQLRFDGYEVETSGAGEQAVECLSSMGLADPVPDLVLVDLHMPGIAGNALARKLRTVSGPARLVAMSATRPDPVETGEFDGFVLKPLDLAKLRELVNCGGLVGDPVLSGPDLDSAVSGELQDGDTQKRHEEANPNLDNDLKENTALGPEELDTRIYSNLKSMMGQFALTETYSVFLRDVRERVAVMRGAEARGDSERVRLEAHAIKGGAAMVGARRILQVAARVEAGGYRSKELPLMLNNLLSACDSIGDNLFR